MKFVSKPLPEHEEVPLADDGRWESIVEHWSQRAQSPTESGADGNAVYVLSVGPERDPQIRQAQLQEILDLVETQGDRVVGSEIYYLNKPQARTLIGKGASREIADRAHACGATLLVLDAELTPSQMRNLEDEAGIAVTDREAVILNVFLRHASTRRAKIQVEIAQLEYLRPRIRGIGINMDQQMGGVAGSRGPGETASELLARKLDGRLSELKRVQKKLRRQGDRQRKHRENCQRIVLVGYTNAGKTSLMNALTEANLSAKNMPFETLDTVSRCLSRHGENVLLSDTVGFIRRLPERLLASFESTLSEVREASLLLLVADLSDYEWRQHLRTTEALLGKLEAHEIPRFYVFNKADLLAEAPSSETLLSVTHGAPYRVLSSHDELAVSGLKEALLERVRQEQRTETLFVPYGASHAMDLIYGQCRVLDTESTEAGLRVRIQGYPRVVAQVLREVTQ